MKEKIKFWACTAIAFSLIVFLAHYKRALRPQQPLWPYKIIEKTTDFRGMVSVKFTDGLDTAAYDYLTEQEFKRFVETGDPYEETDNP